MQPPEQGPSNRLARERSPYLLLHATNPVDWWPWGNAAVDEARRRDVPLFVSIGYATCHWCHVMARESFRDPEIGRAMDAHFVCVKVDREERPEVDEVCMTACQVFTQLVEGRASGGWPLSIWLEPATLQPLFVGTYFPPQPAHGRPSFMQVIESLGGAWRTRRKEVMEQAARLGALVTRQLSADEAPVTIPDTLARDAVERLMSTHDRTNGGFGGAPKFPQPGFIELLLECGVDRSVGEGGHGGEAMLDAVERTLVAMAAGGIFDQVGGGFHRYAVDEAWVVPHFEKMLYDNGQLASVYARAAIVFDDRRLLEVAQRTCDFVLREMTSPEGGFYCALDAEANGHEGVGYVWTREAFDRALVDGGLASEQEWAAQAFGVAEGPNFRDPHDPSLPPSSVLLDRMTWSHTPITARLERIRSVLLAARNAGPRPATDDKVIPAWNGFMIEGLAETAMALWSWSGAHSSDGAGGARFASAAERAADFVLTTMRREDGELLRVWRNGSADVSASLEDYASVACAALTLARLHSTRADHWIAAARSLLAAAEQRFANDRGGWFDAPSSTLLPIRAQSLDDGALPSGTTLMIEAHRRLAVLESQGAGTSAPRALSEHPSMQRATQAIHAASASLVASPLASTAMLTVMLRVRRASGEGARYAARP